MKNNIQMILLGVCIGVVGVYVWWFYSLSNTVSQDHTNLGQVVDYLNKQIQQSAPVKK